MPNFYDAFNQQSPSPATVHVLRPATTDTPYALTAFNAEVESVRTAANGTRNHSLNAATFNLAQLVAGGALDETEVVDHLTAAALACGLDQDEISNTIASGMRAGKEKPRGIPEEPPRTPTPAVTVLGEPISEIVTDNLADKVHDRLPILDWHEVWAHEDSEEWIVEPLLPARRLIALYSAPKVGKSLLMLELAVAIAQGTQVLGTRIDRPRRVLYVDFENDPYGDVRARLQAMGATPDQLDNLCYLSFPTIAHLDTETGSLELLAAADVYNCEVVVIDTVSRSVGGDENENDTWLNFYRHTGLKLKQAQKALIRLDHAGKDESKGQRGGSAKEGDVDAVWKMTKVTDTTFRLECTHNRMPVTEKVLVLERRTDPLRHVVDPLGNKAAWDAKVADCQVNLDTVGAANDVSNRDAGELLKAAGRGVAKAVLEETLRKRKLRIPEFLPTNEPVDNSPKPVDKCPPNWSGTPNEISTIDLSPGTLRDRGIR